MEIGRKAASSSASRTSPVRGPRPGSAPAAGSQKLKTAKNSSWLCTGLGTLHWTARVGREEDHVFGCLSCLGPRQGRR
eukprot:scaffold11332_cov65-Phaeocystis_antarctica.AAC.6